MRMRVVLGVIALLLVLLVAGGIVYIKSIDVNQYKGLIAQAAKSATGRDLKLEGPIKLSIGWSPALVVEGVSFANASWGTRPEMAKLKRLEVQVELWPLLKKEIRLSRLVLIEPDILLETDRQGRGNWEFGAPGAAGGSGGAGGGLPAGLSVSLLLEKGTLAYRDGKTGAVQKLALDRATTRVRGLDSPVTLDVQGTYMDLPFRVKGQVGALGRILGASGGFPLDVQASFAGVETSVKGEIGDLQRLSGIRLALSAQAASLAALKPLAGDAVTKIGKLSFSAQVKGSLDDIRAENLKLTVGGTDLAGKAGVNLKGRRPMVTADLKSMRVALADFLGGPGGGKPAPAKPAARKDKVFPNDPLPLDALRLADADVRFAAGEVVLPGAVVKDLSLHLALRNGKLSIQPLGAKLAGGAATGGVVLDAGPKTAVAVVKVKGLDVAALLKDAGQRAWVSGKADLSVNLSGQGGSVAALMGSLNGETKLLMGKGAASTAGLDYAIGGFTQVLNTLVSRGTDKMTLNCVASDFQVKNGVATSRALVVDSEFSTIAGEGKIDLGREILDMKVTPKPKSATLNLSVPVKIQGTLAKPKIRPDELALARKLGGVAGIFLFPPAAIVGLGEMGDSDNPCLKLMTGSGKAPAQQQKSGSVVDKTTEGLKQGVEGLQKGLKGLFGR